MIRIKNIRIVDKYMDQVTDLLIEENQIRLLGKEKIDAYLKQQDKKPDLELDGANQYLSPSLVDLHFHLRNPGLEYKQTYEEASKAAIAGGYTKVVAMANTIPVADKKEVFEEVAKGMENLDLQVIQVAAVTEGLQGKRNVDFQELRKYTAVFSDDGKNVDNPQLMREALLQSKKLNFIVMDHNEPEAEMVQRNLELALETKGRIHFCHISKKESIAAIGAAKSKAIQGSITFEISPHHLFSENLSYRVNPPIGDSLDRQALIQSVKNGIVDAIATDHAPHTQEDKDNGAPGIVTIETAFSMVRKVFHDEGISLSEQIKLMSNNPSELLGCDNRIGEGARADLIIYDDKTMTIDYHQLSTRSKNTPYDGWEGRGNILYTIVGGKLYDHGSIKK